MKEPELTNEAKVLIQRYLIKRFILLGSIFTIVSFFLGFFIRDIAKAEAYNKAYSEAAQTIMQLTNKATYSASKFEILESRIIKILKNSDDALKDATDLKNRIKTTLVIQQSDKIVSDITNNLLQNRAFQESVISETSSRINQLETKTKNINVDDLGNTIFRGDIKTLGTIQAYDVGTMVRQKQ